MIEQLKKIKEHYLLMTFSLGLVAGLFLFLHNTLNNLDEILGTLKTTQQMALKSVIWNEEIPVAERSSACDAYLSAGYNSLTKKECEIIIKEWEMKQ